MKDAILNILTCPRCRGNLSWKIETIENGKVKQGILSCQVCVSDFHVRDFIPRFVPTDEYVDTFSFKWNKFYDVQIDILNNTDITEQHFINNTGWTKEKLKGKLVLDAGIGAGRYAEVVSRWGAEVVGVDLSFAVNAAYGNIGQRDNDHILQADLFNLPFEPETFDMIYSIGVLHHTPDTGMSGRNGTTSCLTD